MADPLEGVAAALADRYQIDLTPEGRPHLIGQGGMAAVYLAQDLRHHRPVAIKIIRPGLSALLGPDRFLREIAIAARLNHPHILPLHDSGEAAGQLYYVMPYEQGGTLRDRLEREGPLAVEEAVRIAGEVASALEYAHRQGVVHRDIKPSNILLSGGYALVADFGLARGIRQASGDVGMTGSGLALGTPAYMSPEQSYGTPELDGRSDIYSLGCVLHELLAGAPPDTGPRTAQTSGRRRLASTSSLRKVRPEVPRTLERVLGRALERAPADRFASAGDFADALSAIGSGSLTRRFAWWEWPIPWGRSKGGNTLPRRVGGTLGLLGLVVGAVFGTWWGATRILGPPTVPSLIVLPFENRSHDPGKDYLVEGIHEALITALGGIGSLRVMSRTTAMSYRQSGKTISQIAGELDVNWAVEAAVLPAGDSVRIQLTLLRARPERVVWTEEYHRDLRSTLAMDEVVGDIVKQIPVTPTPQEVARLEASARPSDLGAQDRYLRGLQQLYGRDPKGIFAAIDEFQLAIAIDPGYAAAQAALARAYSLALIFWYTPADSAYSWAARALNLADRAIQLDSTNAMAHLTRATVSHWVGAPGPRVEASVLRAIQLQPSYADPYPIYGYYLVGQGRVAEAYDAVERAIELDPIAPGPRIARANTARIADDWERVFKTARQTRTLYPNLALAWAFEGLALRILGRSGECLALKGLPAGVKAICLHAVGRTSEADSLIGLVAGGWTSGDLRSPPYYLVWYYALAGRLKEAILWTERAFERSPAGFGGPGLPEGEYRLLDQQGPRFRMTVERLRRQAWERVLAESRTVALP